MRLAVPALLLVVNATALCGCIYIPTFGLGSSGKDIAALVGDAGSDRLVRADAATIDDAVRLLGRPQYVAADGRHIGYTWMRTGGVVLGLCNGVDKERWLIVLGFDDASTLRGVKLDSSRTNFYLDRSALPADLLAKGFDLKPTPPDWTPPRAAATRSAATLPALLPALPTDAAAR